jgi:hypothetical protein
VPRQAKGIPHPNSGRNVSRIVEGTPFRRNDNVLPRCVNLIRGHPSAVLSRTEPNPAHEPSAEQGRRPRRMPASFAIPAENGSRQFRGPQRSAATKKPHQGVSENCTGPAAPRTRKAITAPSLASACLRC